jgi:hypothetical protein
MTSNLQMFVGDKFVRITLIEAQGLITCLQIMLDKPELLNVNHVFGVSVRREKTE